MYDILADGRFATGKAYFSDALRDEKGGQIDDFRSCEDLDSWRKLNSLLGHAIETSQVATLRNADAEVVVLPVEGVCQEVGEGFRMLQRG